MVKFSNFHATINFNKDDEALIYAMREAVEAMVDEDHLFEWLRLYEDGQQKRFDDATMGDVKYVRLRAAFEHGGKHNRGLHVHILIEVEHDTMVQISKYGLCQIFRDYVHENPNCHVRFVKGEGEDKDFILHYITKEVPEYRPQSQLNARLKYAFGGTREEVEAETLVL